jgi:hypothetical protein
MAHQWRPLHALAPTLTPGDVVILGSHKGKPARNAIRARGAHLLFLPPYSPDLNPIEQVFAKPKHLIRTAERAATGRDAALCRGLRAPPRCSTEPYGLIYNRESCHCWMKRGAQTTPMFLYKNIMLL